MKNGGGEWLSMQRERMGGEPNRRFWWEIEGPENDGVSAIPAARLSTSSVGRKGRPPSTDVTGSGSYGYEYRIRMDREEEHVAQRDSRGSELC